MDISDDGVSNPSDNETFDDVSRRSLLRGGLVAAAGAVVLSGVQTVVTAIPAGADDEAEGTAAGATGAGEAGTKPAKPLIGFTGIAPSSADTVVVAPGYTAEVLIRWGDPVSNGPSFADDASNSAAEQAQQWGAHNDGLVYFPIGGSSTHGLLVQNHEYADEGLLFPDGTANWDAAKTEKSMAAHGVGIIEVRKRRGEWEVVRPSRYARRITMTTPMTIAGPAAGDALLQTSADPTGRSVLGTLNNCAMGYTPWGTYLTCEENINGYFRKLNSAPTALEARYGINNAGFGYLWHTSHPRFLVDTEPNEPNRFGWVVEIDPWNPNSTPVKHTALGRCKHEAARCQVARDGRLVVYTGDDERFEYVYKFISTLPWKEHRRRGESPLDHGTLYVAKFNAGFTGQWLELSPNNPALASWTLPQILVNARGAADAAGATKMDRPEWIETVPGKLMGLVTCTNNTRRGTGTNPAVDAANPRTANNYGQIVRWGYDNDFTELTFWWDHHALAGDSADPASGATVNGDKYGSPDGLYVAPSGRIWIQTDVGIETINAGPYAGFGNNQMLCSDPVTKRTRRFLVGPNGCEVTGCMTTPDERTMFVGIQHPGETITFVGDPNNPKAVSSWPDGPTGGRPRSSLLVITKDDGGKIGT